MKKLGDSATGGVILEASDREWEALRQLNSLMEGRTLIFSETMRRDRDFPHEIDMLPAFDAIVTWSMIKNHANDLRDLADRINEHLMLSAEKSPDGK